MSTYKGLLQLGFEADKDFELWGNDGVITIAKWFSSEPQPTDSAIEAASVTWQTNYDALDYSRKRKAKYDALNQFELISDDAINGTTTHKDAILAIKAEFPKPS